MKIISFVTFLLFSVVAWGSNIKSDAVTEKKFSDAEAFYKQKQFEEALPLYLFLDSILKDANGIKYKIGICYLNSSIEKEKAIKYLEKASINASSKYSGTLKDKYAPLDVFSYLGKAYHYNYQFDEAIASYEKFKTTPSISQELKDSINHEIQLCNNGKELVAVPVSIKTNNLGPVINSKYPDYSPVFTADESALIYTSRRKGSTGNKMDSNGKYLEDIFVSYKTGDGWSTPLSIGPAINTAGNEATAALSIDGQKLVICKDDGDDLNLYTSMLEGNTWSAPKKMSDFVNSPFKESGASISADGNLLYLASNREGGFGGMDIYRSKKLPNGEWGRPVNLGPSVNSPYDEVAPYIHPDGMTLFFSSNGHKNMGGYDIFFSSLLSDTEGWSEPLNMGYPLNSTDDDIFFVPTVGNKRAYYSSFKQGGYGDKDIYEITFADQRETPLAVFKGTVTALDGTVPDFLGITVIDDNTNEIIGEYSPNMSTGKYLFILSPGSSYTVSYSIDGEEVYSDKIQVAESVAYSIINKAVELSPVKLTLKK